MVEKPDAVPPVAFEVPPLSAEGSAHAPFLYFEEATAFGHFDGVLRITLEAIRLYPQSPQDGVSLERVVVAHLRMNTQAALSLKRAIDGALFLAAPPSSDAKN